MLVRAVMLAAAMVVLSPAAAPAQFTGVVVPPKRDEPARTDTSAVMATADTSRETRLADMRSWVDSAAASLGVGATPAADSATLAETRRNSAFHDTSHVAAREGAVRDGDMRTGMRAPDTATLLPLLTLAGAVFLSAGTFLVCTRRPRSEGDAPPARDPGEQHA